MAGLAPTINEFSPDLPPPEIAVVVARYHAEITGKLLEGAKSAYQARFGQADLVRVFHVPGAFEIPALISFLISQERYHAFVALGCIVKGETSHDQILGNAVTQSLANLSLEVPIGLGVLTVDSLKQAQDRAGGSLGNKGADAMQAALALTSVMDQVLIEAEEDERQLNARSSSHAPSSRSGAKPRKKESR